MGTKCPPLGLRCVFIRLAYCMALWCKIVCNMLTYMINNIAVSKIEDVKQFCKKRWGTKYTLFGLLWVLTGLTYGGLNHLQSL
jgi:hypothetical protein